LSLNFNGSFSFFNFLFLFILLYEIITLILETWGCFHYGWWNLGYSAITNSVLVFIMLGWYNEEQTFFPLKGRGLIYTLYITTLRGSDL